MQFPQPLSWYVEARGDGVHLIVSGGLDHRAYDDFDLAMGTILTGCPRVLVLDLTKVESVSAEGTAALVDAMLRAVEVCASMVVLPSPAVRHRLHLLGLDEVLTLGGDAANGHTPPAASA